MQCRACTDTEHRDIPLQQVQQVHICQLSSQSYVIWNVCKKRNLKKPKKRDENLMLSGDDKIEIWMTCFILI